MSGRASARCVPLNGLHDRTSVITRCDDGNCTVNVGEDRWDRAILDCGCRCYDNSDCRLRTTWTLCQGTLRKGPECSNDQKHCEKMLRPCRISSFSSSRLLLIA